jgi:hypothetical protein
MYETQEAMFSRQRVGMEEEDARSSWHGNCTSRAAHTDNSRAQGKPVRWNQAFRDAGDVCLNSSRARPRERR